MMNNSTANVTDEIVNSASLTANEIILNYLSVGSGLPMGDSIIFWVVSFLFGTLIFISLSTFTDFQKSVIIVFSAVPMLAFDIILSFGTYTFYLPFIGELVIDRLVMTSQLVDWIFGFHIFDPALSIMARYTVQTPFILDGYEWYAVMLFTGAISIGDSLIQFCVFFMAAYYGISVVEDRANRQFTWQIPIAMLIGAIPVLWYALSFSNPIHEFEQSNLQIQSVLNFFVSANVLDKCAVVTMAIVAFFIVLIVIAVFTRFVLSVGITVVPSMQQKQWTTSYGAVAFLTTMLYTFLFIMHPDYKWYLILMVIVVWKMFRHFVEDMGTSAKMRTRERLQQKEQVRMIVDELKNPGRPTPKSSSTMFNIEVIIAVIAMFCFFIGLLLFTGALKV